MTIQQNTQAERLPAEDLLSPEDEKKLVAAMTYVDTIDAMYATAEEREEFVSEKYYQQQCAVVASFAHLLDQHYEDERSPTFA